ncbi:MAG: type I-E CRISPR-associated protein Cas6/Cse3/CasE [Syntrophobacterales bacterium]|nr:type I-E CRISPR-associated protein Cas6/Cse3/CasE [Syntrophobacterales bacterium]
MYLSRVLLNPRSKAVQRDLADPQELHRTIMSAFPRSEEPGESPRARFGVLHRLDLDRRQARLILYVQSQLKPDWSALPPDYLLLRTGWENPATKSVAEVYQTLKAGLVLSFRLKANPSRKIDTKTGPDGRRRHGRRVELVREEDQVQWLQRKGEQSGFKVLQVRVGGLTKERSRSRQGTAPTLAGVIFEGHLEITDPDLFRQALARGIGPGKAYGLGLLSLAPP